MKLTGEATLNEARAWLRSMLRQERDTKCPMCGKPVVTASRTFNHNMAKTILVVANEVRVGEWFRATPIIGPYGLSNSQAEWSKIRFWGLIKRRGRNVWALTKNGRAFARGQLAIPETVVFFRDSLRRIEGRLITIRDVKDFNLEATRRKLGL